MRIVVSLKPQRGFLIMLLFHCYCQQGTRGCIRTNPNSFCVHVLQISMRINLNHFRVFTKIIPEIYIYDCKRWLPEHCYILCTIADVPYARLWCFSPSVSISVPRHTLFLERNGILLFFWKWKLDYPNKMSYMLQLCKLVQIFENFFSI